MRPDVRLDQKKLEAAFGSPPDLNLLLAASDEELRAAGMSRQKSGYIRSLSDLVISGELNLEALPKDDEDVKHLKQYFEEMDGESICYC